ncbi:MAG: rhodanese-like domain-containing protein [Bacteroidetes bacterium]|nr:rhodanese-like domain-containing protein [Bacteroidota bacterium]
MSNLFQNCKLQINGICYVLPSEVIAMLKQGAVLVDLREEVEIDIKSFGVDPVIYLPHYLFEENWESLPLEKPLILADSVGIWSKKFTSALQAKGHLQVASLAGGFNDWDKDGFPVRAGKCQPLNGPCLCMIKPHEKK